MFSAARESFPVASSRRSATRESCARDCARTDGEDEETGLRRGGGPWLGSPTQDHPPKAWGPRTQAVDWTMGALPTTLPATQLWPRRRPGWLACSPSASAGGGRQTRCPRTGPSPVPYGVHELPRGRPTPPTDEDRPPGQRTTLRIAAVCS